MGGASRTRRLLYGLTALVALGAVMGFVVPAGAEVWGAPTMAVGYGVAGGLFLAQARREVSSERKAWGLIGTGLLIGAVGVVVMAVITLLGVEVAAFGPLDLFFLTAYCFTLSGFWVLPHLEGPPFHRFRIALDGLVGSISIGVVAWVWIIDDVSDIVAGAGSVWEVVIASAYPVFDVGVLVAVMLVTLRRSNYRFDPRMVLFGLGASAQAIADLTFFKSGIGNDFVDAAPPFAVYMLAAGAFLAAGSILGRVPAPREYAERKTPWWAVLAPYGAALLLLVMLVLEMRHLTLDRHVQELFVGALLVMILVFVRQGVAIRENRELVERQRSALVSSISHELRTPLTAMVGFLDIVTDDDQHMEESSRREMLGIVDQQARYMARIVSDLVMLNRREPDLVLQPRSVALEPLITAAVDSTNVELASGVAIEVEPGLVGYLDPDRLQQVVVNLLTNAARYGGPHRLVRAVAEGEDLVLEVHDDGPGVPKRYEIAIWERFERGAHRYDAGIPGSGIGLAIVDMLIRAHDGLATYRRSERLGGACFAVSLPGRAGARVEAVPPPARQVEEDPAGSRRR